MSEIIYPLQPETKRAKRQSRSPRSGQDKKEFVVRGTVRQPDGTPLVATLVRAFDKDMRREESLGEQRTDESGRYEITYSREQFCRAEKEAADLIVRAFALKKKTPLAVSDVRFNARSVEIIDLTVGGGPYLGPSEYENVVAQLAPLVEKVPFAGLSAEDVRFLVSETGIDAKLILSLAAAHRLKPQLEVPAEVFYGLFRQDLPTDLPGLLGQSTDAIRAALASSVRQNIIPPRFGDQIEKVLQALKKQVVKRALEVSDGGKSFAPLLGAVLPELNQQEAFLTAYVNHKGSPRDFWKKLRSKRSPLKEQVDDIQFALQAGALTKGHAPLVQELQRLRGAKRITSLKDLARFDEGWWLGKVGKNGEKLGVPEGTPGKDAAEKAANYARAMAGLIENAFPTTTLMHRLDKGRVTGREDVVTFLKNNADFDILTSRFQDYVESHAGALVGVKDVSRAKSQVQAMQRLYKLAPKHEHVDALLEDGVDSARGITGMGLTTFQLKYSKKLGGKTAAKKVFEKAEHTTAMALHILMEYGLAKTKVPLATVPDTGVTESDGIPDWQSLFGALDFCECEQCRSVYSPAAYLVDVLHFLKERRLVDTVTRDATGRITGCSYRKKPSSTVDMSVKDVLFGRRPDIGEIELTCQNTNTPLPCVDLINEVLEEAVAPFPAFSPFILPSSLKTDLDAHNVSSSLQTKFTPGLSEHAVITVMKKGEWWAIDDLPFTYSVRQDSSQLRVLSRSRQTGGTAQERAANPQYINVAAYDKLKQQVFPWQLPFDLWLEEARTFLKQLDVRRYELMEAFTPGDRAAALSDDAIAGEYLGLNAGEARLITGETIAQTGASSPVVPGVWNLWGFNTGTLSGSNAIPAPSDATKWISSGNWLDLISGRVDVFLQQSGLHYRDMLSLLGTEFLNPTTGGKRKITIDSTDSSAPDTCEIAKLKLTGFDRAAAVNTTRFVRLWRKLGWTIPELDKAITALNPAHFSETTDAGNSTLTNDTIVGANKGFLRQLSHIKRLQSSLGLPVTSILSFWANIDKARYTDYDSPGQPAVPSLYEKLFRAKSVTNPLDTAFTEDTSKLSGKLSEHFATITAAFGTSADDLAALAGKLPDDVLNLDNLSAIYRHASLSKALKLSVPDYLSLLRVTGDTPFGSTASTVQFAEKVERVRNSGVSIAELDYLLCHQFSDAAGVAPGDNDIARVLDDLRTRLQQVQADNSFIEDLSDPRGITADPDGELTRKKLALLDWDTAAVDRVIAILNDAVVYETALASLPASVSLPNDTGAYEVPLSALPSGLAIPHGLVDIVSYDPANMKLKASRALTEGEQQALLGLSTVLAYKSAVQALYEQSFELAGKIAFDAARQKLQFTGIMTTKRRDRLLLLSSNSAYQNAIAALYAAPRTFLSRQMQDFAIRDFAETLAALPSAVKFTGALEGKVYYDRNAHKLHFAGVMTETERVALQALSSDVPFGTAVGKLYDDATPDPLLPPVAPFLDVLGSPIEVDSLADATRESRFLRILRKLLPYLSAVLSQRLVKQDLAEALKLDRQPTEDMLTRWVNSPAQPSKKVMADFLDAAFTASNPAEPLTRNAFGPQFSAYTRLHKAALIASRFAVTPVQLRWLFEGAAAGGWLELNNLPLAVAVATPATFLAWEKLVELFQVRDSFPLGEALLDGLFECARSVTASSATAAKNSAKSQYVDALLNATGWSEANVAILIGKKDDSSTHGAMDVSFPADYHDAHLLSRLRSCTALAKRLGMSSSQCQALAGADIDNDISRSAVQAVRGKYDEAQWLDMAKPLRDVLREQQRSALVAYMVSHPFTVTLPDGSKRVSWRDVNDLYAYFLIDVEMTPVQMTSRIKQAISSAQLFVQRCLMNLEKNVIANAEVDVNWIQWKWMKSYRVWEANRKVFLYPENWIEPDLRDDKSPFFKDLENDLAQGEVTMDSAEAALGHYLEQLDAVAHLEVAGMYRQTEKDLTGNTAVDVLHVIARTHSAPYTYYYRRYFVGSAYWTAWERVDLDIEGEHLIPVVWNRRLHLFWPVFTKETVPQATVIQSGQAMAAPQEYWKVQMASSCYQNGKWSRKRISKSDFKTAAVLGNSVLASVAFDPDKAGYLFKATSQSDDPDLVLQMFLRGYYTGYWRFAVPIAEFRFIGYGDEPEVKPLLECDYIEGSFLGVRSYNWVLVGPPETNMKSMMFVQRDDAQDPFFLPTESGDKQVLAATPGNFSLLAPHQDPTFSKESPFFYSDAKRTFFVTPAEKRIPQYEWTEPDRVDLGTIDFEMNLTIVEVVPDIAGPVINPPDDPVVYEPSFTATREFERRAQPGPAVTTPMEGTATPEKEMTAYRSRALVMPMPATGTETPYVSVSIPIVIAGMEKSTGGSWHFTGYEVKKGYRFMPFYHPYVPAFARSLNRDGVDGLMQRPLELKPYLFLPSQTEFSFNMYKPQPLVLEPYPVEDVDFLWQGSYSQYNWELFFHVPMLIADRLTKNQRFEEAQRWFHYVFDPTDTSGLKSPQRYWRMRRFYETIDEEYRSQQVQTMLRFLAQNGSDAARSSLSDSDLAELEAIEKQIDEWRKNPFKPHLVARLRTTAYQKTVVMKYIDNLIAWGDQLFRRDTIESINEATQLYVMAAEILGRRPEDIPARAIARVQTFNTLEPLLDDSSNALVQIEEMVPASGTGGTIPVFPNPYVSLPTMLYFSVPKNDKLLGYWDTVSDRLFKIRHGMNIEGIVRQLALFEPPIDPALLVKAAAAGVDIGSALSDISAALPHYRFNVMSQKAGELCSEIKALGGALLSALEKRDAEGLALLRSTHEIKVLKSVRQVKERQIDEAKAALEGLKSSRKVIEERHNYYANILAISPLETAQLALMTASTVFKVGDAAANTVGALVSLIPNIKIGAPTGMGLTYGGDNIAAASQLFGTAMRGLSSVTDQVASLTGLMSGWERRAEDWALQSRLSAKELEQIDKQIVAAEIRIAITERELSNQDIQVENAQDVDAYMHDKFTNHELYSWMVGQISAVYFQSYQLAYDVAKRAEMAYRHELAVKDSSFIQFGYWDSLKKGLLAGERLYHDIKRMEVAYLDQNRREYELTKHISLDQLDPLALILLKQTGECYVDIPEALFDVDYAGHYMRRIKSVSFTIPCVTGPNTGVSCTLTLLKSSVRHGNTLSNNKHARGDSDNRFTDYIGAVQSIVTSSAQNDSGLFEPNLHDERYAPFEGYGAISTWHIEMPAAFRQLDYSTISDVIIHMRYTAREGGGLLKQQATSELQTTVNNFTTGGAAGLVRVFSLRHEFPSEWYLFLNPAATATGDQSLTMGLDKDRFPYIFQGKTIAITAIDLYAQPGTATLNDLTSTLNLSLQAGTAASASALPNAPWHGLVRAVKSTGGATGDWTLTAWKDDGDAAHTHKRLDPKAVQDILIVCRYTV